MPFELSRTYRFEAAHSLPKVPPEHKCRRVHGHSYVVSITLCGELNSESGWIVDFGEIDNAWKPINDALDHRYLNDIEGLENPTSEVLALWIYERMQLSSVKIAAITVHETCRSEVTYRPI